jgi:hypothetical protein
VMNIYVAYTGSRRSEVIGLLPECVHDDQVPIHWKLYELNGRFYRSRPKDGSMRPADLPSFQHGWRSGRSLLTALPGRRQR